MLMRKKWSKALDRQPVNVSLFFSLRSTSCGQPSSCTQYSNFFDRKCFLCNKCSVLHFISLLTNEYVTFRSVSYPSPFHPPSLTLTLFPSRISISQSSFFCASVSLSLFSFWLYCFCRFWLLSVQTDRGLAGADRKRRRRRKKKKKRGRQSVMASHLPFQALTSGQFPVAAETETKFGRQIGNEEGGG